MGIGGGAGGLNVHSVHVGMSIAEISPRQYLPLPSHCRVPSLNGAPDLKCILELTPDRGQGPVTGQGVIVSCVTSVEFILFNGFLACAAFQFR